MPVVTPSRASTMTVNAVPSGASLWSVIGRRPSWSARSSVRQRQIEPARVGRHEVDRLGRRELRGDHQVALVLAVRVVDDDDHAALADLLDRLFDRRERGRHGHRPKASRRQQLLDVLREHVDLEVHGGRRRERRRASSPRACAGSARPRSPASSTPRRSGSCPGRRSSPSRRRSGAARAARRTRCACPRPRARRCARCRRRRRGPGRSGRRAASPARSAGSRLTRRPAARRAERRARERLRHGVEDQCRRHRQRRR